MNRTSICLGSDTRDALRDYKQEREHPNYDAAITALLNGTEEVTV